MDKYIRLIKVAEKLNDVESEYEINAIISNFEKIDNSEDFDLYSMIYIMCLNKEVHLKIVHSEENDYKKVPIMINKVCNSLKEKYNEIIDHIKITENSTISEEKLIQFKEFMTVLIATALVGIEYQRTDRENIPENNEWNTQYRREERVRDRMRSRFINPDAKHREFVLKYGIQIPFIYAFVWDMSNVNPHTIGEINRKETENNSGYYANLKSNLGYYLEHIDDDMKEIILVGGVRDPEEKPEKGTLPNAAIYFIKWIKFTELIPTFENDNRFDVEVSVSKSNPSEQVPYSQLHNEDKNEKVRYIRPEILKQVPLFPMKSEYSYNVLSSLAESYKVNKELRAEKNKVQKLYNELEIAQRKNSKLVANYAHTIENIIKPSLILDIAECIKATGNRELYNQTLNIYFNEMTTQNECRLINMIHSSSVTRGVIRESISKAQFIGMNDAISIEEIVYLALYQITTQIINEDSSSRYTYIRNKLHNCGLNPKILSDILWLNSNKRNTLSETYKNYLNIEFVIDNKLKNVRLVEREVGTSFVYSRIIELLTNMFTYADLDRENIKLLKIGLNNDEYLVFETINKIGKKEFFSSGEGLDSTRYVLSRINFPNSHLEDFVKTDIEDDTFICKMYIDSDLFIDLEE